MNPPVKTPLSAYLIMIPSCFVAFIGFMMYSLSDVRNTYDFLLPLLIFAQLVFAIMILIGKKIGLIGLVGLTLLVIGLLIATLVYYANRNQLATGLLTAVVISIVIIPILELWTRHKDYFKNN